MTTSESSVTLPADYAAPSETAWEAIDGAYDLQVHVAPDVVPRRIDDVALAREFLDKGLRGFVLKSHYVPTAERAKVVCNAVPGIAAYGAISLNHSVGGINPVAVDIAGRSGTRIVWMPTVDAANEAIGRDASASTGNVPVWAAFQLALSERGIAPDPITVLDDDGRIDKVTRQCLDLMAEHDMILASGHLSRDEIFALVPAAKEAGVKRIVITHPEFPSQSLTADEQQKLGEMGAFLEHCFTTTHTGKAAWATMFTNLTAAGAARCILSTDLGQVQNPPVAEGLASFAQQVLNAGFSVDDVRRMCVTNTTALVEPDGDPEGV